MAFIGEKQKKKKKVKSNKNKTSILEHWRRLRA